MDIRNVQKTGNMHYIYLPTNWCKKNNISSKSQVSLIQDSENRLLVDAQKREIKNKNLNIDLNEDDLDILNKVIMACYINPAESFRIKLSKELDFSKILEQKKIVSLELIEIDEKKITCDSQVTVADPFSLLKTMTKKVKNLIWVMSKNYNKELIQRYEEEIDRTKMLIEKSVISSFTVGNRTKLRIIDLYYISTISRNIEQLVDHLIKLEMNQTNFLKIVSSLIDDMKKTIEEDFSISPNQMLKSSISFIKKIHSIKDLEVKDVKTYDKMRIKLTFQAIGEVLVDWAITKKID